MDSTEAAKTAEKRFKASPDRPPRRRLASSGPGFHIHVYNCGVKNRYIGTGMFDAPEQAIVACVSVKIDLDDGNLSVRFSTDVVNAAFI